MKACGAGAGSSEPESSLGAGESWASTPKPWAPFPRNGHLGHMQTPSPARSPSPLQAPPGQLHQESGPCRSWAAGLCTWTPTPRGSLTVQATGVPRTLVSGAVPRSVAPVQLTHFQELCWSAPEQTSGTQETAVLPSIPDSQHGSPVWVSLCAPSPAQAHSRI